jgi:hypothetical protein
MKSMLRGVRFEMARQYTFRQFFDMATIAANRENGKTMIAVLNGTGKIRVD